MTEIAELDTTQIAHQMDGSCDRLHVAMLACYGLESVEDGKLISELLYEIEIELRKIVSVMRQSKPETAAANKGNGRPKTTSDLPRADDKTE